MLDHYENRGGYDSDSFFDVKELLHRLRQAREASAPVAPEPMAPPKDRVRPNLGPWSDVRTAMRTAHQTSDLNTLHRMAAGTWVPPDGLPMPVAGRNLMMQQAAYVLQVRPQLRPTRPSSPALERPGALTASEVAPKTVSEPRRPRHRAPGAHRAPEPEEVMGDPVSVWGLPGQLLTDRTVVLPPNGASDETTVELYPSFDLERTIVLGAAGARSGSGSEVTVTQPIVYDSAPGASDVTVVLPLRDRGPTATQVIPPLSALVTQVLPSSRPQ